MTRPNVLKQTYRKLFYLLIKLFRKVSAGNVLITHVVFDAACPNYLPAHVFCYKKRIQFFKSSSEGVYLAEMGGKTTSIPLSFKVFSIIFTDSPLQPKEPKDVPILFFILRPFIKSRKP